ncbi:adenylyltransferase/cytidyltransferase family protein [Marivirga tractuosa]|uniref:adenylyltransferase/cytidyltransferase family protein n=1 Tax=Marivirga tractuosa TaxID=1006 RepID=UPI0035CEBA7B
MKNRCLFLIEAAQIDSESIQKLCNIAKNYEEAIFVLKNADQLHEKNIKSGELLISLHDILKTACKVPFYVLPFANKGNSGLSYWLKLKLLTPTFTTLYSTHEEDRQAVGLFLNGKFELLEFEKEENTHFINPSQNSIKRGLFISRAQPLHNGHAAIIEQMAAENEEFIVLLSTAELSHFPQNPLSAAERLEMLHRYLHLKYPNQFYLVALPQNAFTLENMYELKYLLPDFQSVYATNPAIVSMSKSMNIAVKPLDKKVNISATEIRNKILKQESCRELVPEAILSYLQEINFYERLQLVNHQYER